MTNEEINAKLSSLYDEEDKLLQELDRIEKLENVRKADLKREVAIRRRLDEITDEVVALSEKQDLNKKNERKRLGLSIAFIGLAGILGFCAGSTIKKNCKPSEDSSRVITITTPVPTADPILVDVTNEEEVTRAASHIYNEDVEPMLEDLDDEVFNNSFNEIDIEDIIRVANGELPMYSEYDDYTIGETANMMNHIFANRGLDNNLYPMHFSKFYPDNSKEAEYIKTYDEIYNKIAEYRKVNYVDGVIEQVGLLGSKLYNEWHLAGLYGGYDPYIFPDEEHYFLLQAATSRFSNYVREYLEANDLTVCIHACYDQEVQAYKLVEVRDIFEAMYMGTSKNGEISVLRSGEVVNLFGETFADAKNYLDAKANNNTKVLK